MDETNEQAPVSRQRPGSLLPPIKDRDSGEHEWFEYNAATGNEGSPMTCCRKCGVVQTKEGNQRKCRGVVKVGPRADEPAPSHFALAVLWHVEQLGNGRPVESVETGMIGQRLWPWQIAYGSVHGGPDSSGVAAGFQLPAIARAGLIGRVFVPDAPGSRYAMTARGRRTLETHRASVPEALARARSPLPGAAHRVLTRWGGWAAWQVFTHRKNAPGDAPAVVLRVLFPTAPEGARLVALTKLEVIERDGALDNHDAIARKYSIVANEGALHADVNAAARRLAAP